MSGPLEALRRGQWGFTLSTGAVLNFQRADILSINQTTGDDGVPLQRWTIVIGRMRYSGGTLLTPANPDNQVDSRFALELSWGANEGSDQAVVDYPCRGGSFCLSADYFRMVLVRDSTGPAIGPPPTVSGYVTPTSPMRAVMVPPTRTLAVTLIGASSSVLPIPARAVAYRLWAAPSTATAVTTTQLQGDQASLGMPDMNALTGLVDGQQTNRAGYRPLHPTAEFIAVTSAEVGTVTVWMSFMLDLG